jgi:hypothetical protein
VSGDLSRWWYDRPRRGWRAGDWLLPCLRFYECGDEFCNDTLFLRIPLVGHLYIRTGRRPFRVNAICEECVVKYGPWCYGCQGPHRGPRCHDWLSCEHLAQTVVRCPACGGDYCPACEPEPRKSCPYTAEPTPPDVAFYWERPYDPDAINNE